MAKLGSKIKKIRVSLGYTQEEFAKMLEIETSSAISNWERGKRKPDYETLVKIAYVGRTSTDWLMKDEDESEYKITKKYEPKPHQLGLPLDEQITLLREKLLRYEKIIATLKSDITIMQKECAEKEGCLIKNFKFPDNNDK